MPAYKKLDVGTLQAAPGPHPAGQETVAHDHAADGAEDVYAVIRGTGTAVIDGEEVSLAPGEFIAVQPESIRQVRAGADGQVFIAVCAPTAPKSG